MAFAKSKCISLSALMSKHRNCSFLSTNTFSAEEYVSLFSFNIWKPHPDDCEIYRYKGMKQHSFDISKSNQNWLDLKIRQRYDRPEAIQTLLKLYSTKVDIFAFQELSLPSYEIIQQSIGALFACIHHILPSKDGYPTDIFWHKDKYELLYYDYKTKDDDGQSLCWCIVRLLSKATNQIINIISTHFHTCFYEDEIVNGSNPRVNDMKAIISVINKYVKRGEAVFIAGDFNDFFIPQQYFISSTMFEDRYSNVFRDMGERAPFTYPSPAAFFDANIADAQAEVTYDWQFFKKTSTNLNVEALSANVLRFHHMGIYPSDHYPLHAVYCIKYADPSKL